MNVWNVSVALSFLFFLSAVAHAVPGSLTYQGRIKNTDGLPLEVNGVKFEFAVVNPTGSCILYRETSGSLDMRNSGGVFDVPIGPGTKNYPADPSFKLLDSFTNSTTFNCEGGGTYTPVTDDKRLLRVQFYDGTGWKLISPDSEIRSVPFAGHAKIAQTANLLGNNAASDFVLKSSAPLCAAGQYLRHIAPAGTFQCTEPSVAGANVTGNIAGSSAGFTGNLSGDVSGAQTATSVDKIKGVALDMTGIASGKVLKYNGTSWIPATDDGTSGAITGLIGDVSSSGSPVATVTLTDNSVVASRIADGAVNSAKIADGTIVDADISASANIADSKLATISAAGKVSGNAIMSGTIGGSTVVNTTGSVTSAVMSTGTLGVNNLQIFKTGNGNKVTVTAPSSLAADYSIELPTDDGASGQVLSTDGNGALSWISPSTGSVTSVTAAAPLTSTGGSTPVISLNNSGVIAGTYTKVTVDSKGIVTTGGNIASGDVPNLSGDVTSTSGSGGTKVEKIQGVAVSSTPPQTGQVLVFGGTQWDVQYFGMGQLRSTVTGGTQIPSSCSANKTLTWSAITDSFVCTTIAIANTQISGLGSASTKNFGTSSGNLVELDGSAKIPVALLPLGVGGSIVDGGNSTAATITIGSNDANSLDFETNNVPRMTVTSGGKVGIGTTSPSQHLHVTDDIAGNRTIAQFGFGSGSLFLTHNQAGISGNLRYDDGQWRYENDGYGSVMHFYDSGRVSIFTAPSGLAGASVTPAERLTIKNDTGNVGIGTTSPSQMLHIKNTSTMPQIQVEGNGSINSRVYLSEGGDSGTYMQYDSTNDRTYLSHRVLGTDNATPNITFTRAGDVGIGTTAPGAPLNVVETTDIGSATDGGAILITTSGTHQLRIDSNEIQASLSGAASALTLNAFGGTVNFGGITQPTTDNSFTLGAATKRWSAVYATNGTIQTSDRRLKKDIRDLNLGLRFITSLRPVSFKWRSDENSSAQTHWGLIAQELHSQVASEGVENVGVVSKNDGEYYGVNYSELIGPLINSVKELDIVCKMSEQQNQNLNLKVAMQDRRIASVEGDVISLKKENAELKARLEKLERLLEKQSLPK